MPTLRSRLNYEPRELGFGTSGRRGLVSDLTQLEIYVNVTGELTYLQSLPRAEGGIVPGDEFYVGLDLRPSSPSICEAVVRAVEDRGMRPVSLGRIPTPALACYAFARQRGSIMVTGSHIPFDRNGYKLNTSRGELMKSQEGPINEAVRAVRECVYAQSFAESAFDAKGMFKNLPGELPPEDDAGQRAYIERYAAFFGDSDLRGTKILVYQHSAVGRDLLVEVLRRLGAQPIAMGRSEEFVPIDTENIDAAQLGMIQSLADEAGAVDAVVSIDGDSDRPLVLGRDASGKVKFFGGDLLGMVVAEYLGADSVVVPISTNDAIDRGPLARVLEPKTRIGSPYVIAGMEEARAKGRRVVCGWEANGGFLTGSDIERRGRMLTALPTRDAFLPILSVLYAAQEKRIGLIELFDRLPKRFSRAALLKNFPRPVGLRLVDQFRGAEQLQRFFTAANRFGPIERIDRTDGVRVIFSSGEVAHIRPSGNADELRIYAVADTQQRADEIAAVSVAEPDGILRQMERASANG